MDIIGTGAISIGGTIVVIVTEPTRMICDQGGRCWAAPPFVFYCLPLRLLPSIGTDPPLQDCLPVTLSIWDGPSMCWARSPRPILLFSKSYPAKSGTIVWVTRNLCPFDGLTIRRSFRLESSQASTCLKSHSAQSLSSNAVTGGASLCATWATTARHRPLPGALVLNRRPHRRWPRRPLRPRHRSSPV
jgi:hypothetical protein